MRHHELEEGLGEGAGQKHFIEVEGSCLAEVEGALSARLGEARVHLDGSPTGRKRHHEARVRGHFLREQEGGALGHFGRGQQDFEVHSSAKVISRTPALSMAARTAGSQRAASSRTRTAA